MISSAIYSILSSDSNITNIVSTRIYPDILPMGVDQPAIIYNVGDTGFETTKAGAVQTRHVLSIIVGHTLYDSLQTLAEAIRTVLYRKTGTFESVKIQRLSYVGEEEKGWDEEQQIHVKSLKFEIIENH